MRGKEVVHSSKSDEWGTPLPLYDWLNNLFAFDIDVAAAPDNAKCLKFLTKEDNALFQAWSYAAAEYSIWCNPPYSKVKDFINKACMESLKHATSIVFLVPARTDTKWFHYALQFCTSVYLIEGRLKFDGNGSNSSAPFPSCLLVWGEDKIKERKPAERLGIFPLTLDKTTRGF